MKLTDKLNKEVKNANANEKVKDITQDTIETSVEILSDEDLDNASGGAGIEHIPARVK